MKIAHLSNNEFNALVSLLERNGFDYPKGNKYAFTITMDKDSIIIYNKDCGIDNDLKQIVIQHERAHLHGILDEEDADHWALRHLNKKQRLMLISNWKERHGYNYLP
jgi:hypothetical protein